MIAITCTYNGCQRAVHSQQMCIIHVRMHSVNIQMELDDFILQSILYFLSTLTIEKCSSLYLMFAPHLSHIGVVPMNGGADSKLNVNAFLAYLTRPIFQYAESIYIPCGESTDRLYVNDIKQICPTERTMYHKKWLPSFDRSCIVTRHFRRRTDFFRY
jgi:hypothetical protein